MLIPARPAARAVPLLMLGGDLHLDRASDLLRALPALPSHSCLLGRLEPLKEAKARITEEGASFQEMVLGQIVLFRVSLTQTQTAWTQLSTPVQTSTRIRKHEYKPLSHTHTHTAMSLRNIKD